MGKKIDWNWFCAFGVLITVVLLAVVLNKLNEHKESWWGTPGFQMRVMNPNPPQYGCNGCPRGCGQGRQCGQGCGCRKFGL